MAVSTKQVNDLLSPRSVAIVGANEKSIWCQNIMSNMENESFQGELFLVNPKYAELYGRKCYPSLADLPMKVDCAAVLVGAELALDIVSQCGQLGIKSIVMISAGFSESGSEGMEREKKLQRLAETFGIAIAGPNGIGFVNRLESVPITTIPLRGGRGQIAFLLQSGSMAITLMTYAAARDIGFSHLITLGNQSVVTSTDYINALIEHPDVKVVACLLETIADADGLKEAAHRAMELGKPIVMMNNGRSKLGAQTASAHTGSLAGEGAVVSAFLKQIGIVEVRTMEELAETAAFFNEYGWPQGPRMIFCSNSGGLSSYVADLLEGTAVELPDLHPDTKLKLRNVLSAFSSPQNPLDMTGQVIGRPDLVEQVFEILAAEPNKDGIVLIHDWSKPYELDSPTGRDEIRRLHAFRKLNIFKCLITTMSSDLIPLEREKRNIHGFHLVNGLPVGLKALESAIRYAQLRKNILHRNEIDTAYAAISSAALLDEEGPLNEVEGKKLLREYGIQTTREAMVADKAEAIRAANEIGYPVVLKVVSSDIMHKTEAGGVELHLHSPEDVEESYDRMMMAVKNYKPEANIQGVLVAEQIENAVEIIAGIKMDPMIGPVVLVGLGGIFVETLQDVAMRVAPFGHHTAMDMINELRGKAILNGARGRSAADVAMLADTLVKLSRLADQWRERIVELDINPLFVLPQGKGVRASDSLVILKKAILPVSNENRHY